MIDNDYLSSGIIRGFFFNCFFGTPFDYNLVTIEPLIQGAMKTTMKTTILLLMMMACPLAASGQSASRGTAHSEQVRKETPVRDHQKAVRHSSPSDRSATREGTSRTTVQHSTASKKISTTNKENSGSNYRQTERSVPKGKTYMDPKRNARTITAEVERNSHNRHAHKVYYPSKRVKVNVHPRMYGDSYRVLYHPSHMDIVWTKKMHRYYLDLYPGSYWRYPLGTHIRTISAFETTFNIGEIARVYGRVYGTWYNRESDDLLLFFGGEYPQQAFTLIVPGKIARRYHWRPERYFMGKHIWSLGLITSFDGNPEMIIEVKDQLHFY